MKKNEIDEKNMIILEDKKNHVGKTLINFLNYEDEEIGFNYVFMGNCGTRGESVEGFFVGRIANHLVRYAVMNPVIVP